MAKLSKKVEQLLAELVPKSASKPVTLPQKNCALVLCAKAKRAAYRSTHAVITNMVNETGAKGILAYTDREELRPSSNPLSFAEPNTGDREAAEMDVTDNEYMLYLITMSLSDILTRDERIAVCAALARASSCRACQAHNY